MDERTPHASATALQHVRVDHSGADVLVAQAFLLQRWREHRDAILRPFALDPVHIGVFGTDTHVFEAQHQTHLTE